MTDYRCFLPAMERFRANPSSRYAAVDPGDYASLLKRIRDGGPLSIRDIDDDVLVEKTHPWGSRKPSRAALRYGFFAGDLVVARRAGMLKTYDLAARHFGWVRASPPRHTRPGCRISVTPGAACAGGGEPGFDLLRQFGVQG